MLQEKYINPFTDFGFKRLFGEEPNKDLLIDFLNELLREEQGEIKKLTYLRAEQLGSTAIDRKAIFDLYCENEKGEGLLSKYKKQNKSSLKIELYIILPFLFENKPNVVNGILN